MSKQNQHKPGYKHTPLGWIPEEWEVKEVSDIGILSSGTTPPRQNHSRFFHNGTIHWVKTTDLNNSDIIRTEEMVTEMALKETSLKLFSAGTVLVAMYGGFNQIGRTGLLRIPATVNQALTAIQLNNGDDPKFILEWFNYRVGYWKNFAGSSRKDPNITGKDVGDFPVLIPTEPEQRKIVGILSTWDEAIIKTQQLIAQLQRRNKGLMQQLLTGKKRLKGFKGEWKRLHIYDVAKEVSLKNRDDKQLTVLSCTKYDGLVPSLEYFGRRVFGSDTSTYKVVQLHHFAYATNHIEEGSIGYQNSFEEALISPMYTVFKTDDQVHDDYLFKLLKSHHYIHEYCKRMEGSIDRRGGLRWDEFSKIVIHLPGLKEQIAIATLINKAVEEIKLYEQKLAALQQQKKGLMQRLLTGEVRVKVN
jgi:type I restriction enzyme S subunit